MKLTKIIFYSIMIIIGSILSELIGRDLGNVFISFSNILAQVVMFITSILFFYSIYSLLSSKLFKNDFKWVSLVPKLKIKYIVPAALLMVLIFIGYSLAGLSLIKVNTQTDTFINSFIYTALLGGATAPIIEEITFRGVILNLFSKKYGYKIAIIIQGFIFGAMHLLNGVNSFTDGFLLLISGGIIGCLLGLVAYLNQSIWASFTIHSIFNIFSSIIPIATTNPGGWPFFYQIHSSNKLITGGMSIQSSIISIISYIIVIFFVIYIQKRQSDKNSLQF